MMTMMMNDFGLDSHNGKMIYATCNNMPHTGYWYVPVAGTGTGTSEFFSAEES